MRWTLMPAVMLAVAIASPSSAQISVYIGTPPPAIVYEEQVPPPSTGFVWIEGYWIPAGHRYKWIRGHWERPPFEGAYWVHAHYDHYREGWQCHEGHWDHEGHDNEHGRDHGRSRWHRNHDDQGDEH